MPATIAPRRPPPDVLPDSLPAHKKPDVLPDDLRRKDQPETPDSLPPVAPTNYEQQVAEAEERSVQEHPEGSAPPLDRLTQDEELPVNE